jgi:hypothetical protein
VTYDLLSGKSIATFLNPFIKQLVFAKHQSQESFSSYSTISATLDNTKYCGILYYDHYIWGFLMKYTKIGVPVLTDVMIEAKAYTLLLRYDPKLLEQPVRISIPLLLNYLKNDFNLEIIATSLGTRGAHKILGKTILSKNLICFDKDLINNEILFNFTAAHAIGHWLLHRSRKITVWESNGAIEEIDDCEIYYWGRKVLRTPRDWIEHQANVFAGSLLMPRLTFRKSVEFVQDQMGIVRSRGKTFVYSHQGGEKDFDEMLIFLRNFWKTSEQSVLNRLKSLGILIEDAGRNPQYISKIFKGMIV